MPIENDKGGEQFLRTLDICTQAKNLRAQRNQERKVESEEKGRVKTATMLESYKALIKGTAWHGMAGDV